MRDRERNGMTEEQIADQLYAWIKEAFEIDDDPEYTKDVHLFDFGFVDSLDSTEIVNYVEETFGIEITQKDIVMYPMNTVNEIAAVVATKVA